MTIGNRHKVRCTCWWLDVTAFDQLPHSSYVRGFSEPDCPAHPAVDLEPAEPAPVSPWVEFGEPEDRKIVFRPVRRRWRWSYFWLAVAVFNLLATCVNIWQQDLAGLSVTGPALVGSLWLVQTTA